MHEVGLMQNALEIAFKAAEDKGASRVTSMGLRIGSLSGVVPDAMRFAFEAMTPGTIAEGAELRIEEILATCWCAKCSSLFETDDILTLCPRCGTPSADVRDGRDMRITFVEVSDDGG